MKENVEDLKKSLNAAKTELRDVRRENEDLRFSVKSFSKSRAEFIGAMCHDYRGPLAALLGFSNLLISEDIAPNLTEKQRDYARHIRTGLQHLLALTNNVFDTISYEFGKESHLNESIIEIDQFVCDTLKLVSKSDGVHLRWVPGPIELPRLYCDPVRVRQILLNLVGNAVKYTDKGDGLVEITVEVSEGLTFVVADNGIGIKPEDIPRALTPFERIEPANTSVTERGLGLGLPLAKALMEAHGGTLTLNSTPGYGTTVRLWFPPNRVHLGSARGVGKSAETLGKGSILIVEDRVDMATYLKDVAEARGYETFMARLGRAALDLAREKRPDQIWMDLSLPDISGLEAVYWLRKDPRTADIPIIGMTAAYGIPERWVLAGGCDAFFSKGDGHFLTHLLHCAEKMVQSGSLAAGRTAIKEENLDVGRIVGECVEWIQVTEVTRPYGVKVSWQQKSASLPRLSCDPGGLRKILWEVLSYLTLEIDQGGQICITAESSGDFSIVIEHDRSSEEPGIGFASAKKLVEQYGGQLSTRGDLGAGTTMLVSFPPERICPETLH
jgi:signal transduction histidine kinase